MKGKEGQDQKIYISSSHLRNFTKFLLQNYGYIRTNKNFVKSYNNSEAVYYKKQLSSKGSSITLITKYFSFPSKAEKFEDGYSAYGAALQLAQEPAQRSHVLTAMATIAFKFQVCCKYKY